MELDSFPESHVCHDVAAEQNEVAANEALGVNLPHGIADSHTGLRNNGVNSDWGVNLSPFGLTAFSKNQEGDKSGVRRKFRKERKEKEKKEKKDLR